VVVNKKIARVYLHPGAKGIPLHRPVVQSSSSNRRQMSNSLQSSSSRKDESWEDDTILDMGNHPSFEEQQQGRNSGPSNPSAMKRFGDESMNRPQQLVYHFQIGSVESFEEKLGKAQQELGIASRDFVPVRFHKTREKNVYSSLNQLTFIFFIGTICK